MLKSRSGKRIPGRDRSPEHKQVADAPAPAVKRSGTVGGACLFCRYRKAAAPCGFGSATGSGEEV